MFYPTYQRSRSSNNFSLVVVLGSMAGAEELVLGFVPWDDTTKVGADSIDAVGCKCFVVLHNEVSRITLKFIKSFNVKTQHHVNSNIATVVSVIRRTKY